MPQTRNNLLLTIFLLVYVSACFAERADRDQPILLESDQVLIDDAKKISTFTGNVQLTQGTLLIRGDKIVVVQDMDGFKHGTVYGKTARFRQKREGTDEFVEGHGERIEYDTRTEAVDFYVQAHVKRGEDEVRGEHITYSLKSEIFQVDGGSENTAGKAPKRVRAVLQPKPKTIPSVPSTPDGLPVNPDNVLTPAE